MIIYKNERDSFNNDAYLQSLIILIGSNVDHDHDLFLIKLYHLFTNMHFYRAYIIGQIFLYRYFIKNHLTF